MSGNTSVPKETPRVDTSVDTKVSGKVDTAPTKVAADQLRSVVSRIEAMEEEKKVIADDIRDIYAEAKGNGYDVKALRTIVRLRKMDANDRAEQETILDTYMLALGMIWRVARIRSTHAGQWTSGDFLECSPLARLLALAVRNVADDHGAFRWKPTSLKAECLPGDIGAQPPPAAGHNTATGDPSVAQGGATSGATAAPGCRARSPQIYRVTHRATEFGLLPDASKMHLVAIWLLASLSETKSPSIRSG